MSSWFTSLGTLHHGFGGRWKLGSLAPAEEFDEAVTKAQLDAIAPVPFAMSVSTELEVGGNVTGLGGMLDKSVVFPVSTFDEPTLLSGIIFYIDILRGSYWGDVTISASAPETVDVTIAKTVVDQTECNSLVLTSFNETPIADDEIIIAITATGGGHSITRTLTINVVADPE